MASFCCKQFFSSTPDPLFASKSSTVSNLPCTRRAAGKRKSRGSGAAVLQADSEAASSEGCAGWQCVWLHAWEAINRFVLHLLMFFNLQGGGGVGGPSALLSHPHFACLLNLLTLLSSYVLPCACSQGGGGVGAPLGRITPTRSCC